MNPEEDFDISIALETLEHAPPDLVNGYLRKMALHTRDCIFISVPNEKGIVFLAKWLSKRLYFGYASDYSAKELFYATIGRMDKIMRNEHKGFDYIALINEIRAYFEIIEVSSIPFGFLPPYLGYGIGIVAKPLH